MIYKSEGLEQLVTAPWSSSTVTMQYLIPFSSNDGLRRKRLWLESRNVIVPTLKHVSLFSPCVILKLILILSPFIQVLRADDVWEATEDLSNTMAPSALDIVPENNISNRKSSYQTKYDKYFVAITTFNPDERFQKTTKNFSYKLGSTKSIMTFASEPLRNNEMSVEVEKPLALAINVTASNLDKIRNLPSSTSIQDQPPSYNVTISSSNSIPASAFSGTYNQYVFNLTAIKIYVTRI